MHIAIVQSLTLSMSLFLFTPSYSMKQLTYNKPIVFAFVKVVQPWSAGQEQHLHVHVAAISEYSIHVHHTYYLCIDTCSWEEQPCCKCTVLSLNQFCIYHRLENRLHCRRCATCV